MAPVSRPGPTVAVSGSSDVCLGTCEVNIEVGAGGALATGILLDARCFAACCCWGGWPEGLDFAADECGTG